MKTVFITDENYAMPTCVAIVSLLHHYKTDRPMEIYILCDDVSESGKSRLACLGSDSIKITLLDVQNEQYESIAEELKRETGIHVSKSALFKFDIPNILKDVDKILYLDGDVIVNRDLSALYDTDISDSYIAAVDDMGDIAQSEAGTSMLATRINLQSNHYFNSGVMLLNLKKMREKNISEKLLAYRKNGLNYFMDQDAFNACLSERRKHLPYGYNFRTPLCYELSFTQMNEMFFDKRYIDTEECIGGQYILHLSDRFKPWRYYIRYFTDIFMQYYLKSPYKNEKPEFQSALNVVISERDELFRKYVKLDEKYRNMREKYNYEKKCRQMMEWRFPSDIIPPGSNIVLYGAGVVGQAYMNRNREKRHCNMVLWVDANHEKFDEDICSPEKIKTVQYDYVLLALSKKEVMTDAKQYLSLLGVEESKILTII